MGSLGAALVAPAGWFLVVEAAVMMWMNNSMDFYKTCFFQKFRQSHHHRGVSWRCFGGTVSRILCKLQHFLLLRCCRCGNNRISVANLCKLQYFLYVASLPLCSKGFQLKAVDFSIPGRSRPGPTLKIDGRPLVVYSV